MRFRIFLAVLIVVMVILGVLIYRQVDVLMDASKPVLNTGDKK